MDKLINLYRNPLSVKIVKITEDELINYSKNKTTSMFQMVENTELYKDNSISSNRPDDYLVGYNNIYFN